MKFAVDLHIHSALSPCADKDMTPNNIVNMALIKGLDIIAVTDHNSAENLESFIECSKSKNILVVPGMEIETREEVHLICLFPSVDSALEMQEVVYKALPKLENREDVFGPQLIMDSNDCILGHVKRMLLTASALSIEEVFENVVRRFGGAVIPAHVNRDSYSIISNLGFIPENLKIKYVEVSKDCNIDKFFLNRNDISRYRYLISSDAHHLGGILERESFIELDEKSIDCLLAKIRQY